MDNTEIGRKFLWSSLRYLHWLLSWESIEGVSLIQVWFRVSLSLLMTVMQIHKVALTQVLTQKIGRIGLAQLISCIWLSSWAYVVAFHYNPVLAKGCVRLLVLINCEPVSVSKKEDLGNSISGLAYRISTTENDINFPQKYTGYKSIALPSCCLLPLFILCKYNVPFKCRDPPFKGEKIHLSD